MSTHLLLDLVSALDAVPDGESVTLPVDGRVDAGVAAQWCDRAGHRFVAWDGNEVHIRRGRGSPAVIPDELRPGRRLWLYTNFDCNLACSYCCVSSSPRTPRRALGLDTIRAVAAEAPGVGARELFLTGGEPFLLPDIGEIVQACAKALPTVVLTNGMLFRGARLATLHALPREHVTLQISLDSATPDLHDLVRGAGSHARARAGIELARELGFRVRVAATLDAGSASEEIALHRLCDEIGIPSEDHVVRRVARQGAADAGVVVTRATLVPEICLTADGVYWHPVAATDPDMLVTRRLLPLAGVVGRIAAEFSEYRRRNDDLALTFPCA